MGAHAPSGGGSLPAQWQVDGDGTLNILDEFDVIRASLTADGKLNMYRADETIVAQVTGPGEGFRIFDAAGNQTIATMSGDGTTGALRINGVAVSSRQTAQIPVTSAQILDLNANPVTLIASPGPNTLILPNRWVVALTFATTPYTLTDGNGTVRGDWVGQPLGGDGGFLSTDNVVFQSSDQFAMASGPAGAFSLTVDTSAYVGKDFILCNPGPDVADGDSDIAVVIEYTTIDLS